MILSNAERQARFRERRRADAKDRIRRYEAQRDKAMSWVQAIDSGQRHYTAVGREPLRDYTDELRAEKLHEAEMYGQLIELWRKDAGPD